MGFHYYTIFRHFLVGLFEKICPYLWTRKNEYIFFFVSFMTKKSKIRHTLTQKKGEEI